MINLSAICINSFLESSNCKGHVLFWEAKTFFRPLNALDFLWLITSPVNMVCGIFHGRYKGKSYRATVEVVKTADRVTEFCRQTCIKLECCPNLFGPRMVLDKCSENCSVLTKTKYSEFSFPDLLTLMAGHTLYLGKFLFCRHFSYNTGIQTASVKDQIMNILGHQSNDLCCIFFSFFFFF